MKSKTLNGTTDLNLQQLACKFQEMRDEYFLSKNQHADSKISWREIISRDVRGSTKYNFLHEIEFQKNCGNLLVAEAQKSHIDWKYAVLALKARIERFTFSSDYTAYFSAFCALAFSVFIALSQTFNMTNYYWYAGIVAAFGAYAFCKGATIRRRVVLYREFLSLIEANYLELTRQHP